tara:strand:- start:135 stop:323 length:189 start_codon:yes stop_codon:yes gene_type:complete
MITIRSILTLGFDGFDVFDFQLQRTGFDSHSPQFQSVGRPAALPTLPASTRVGVGVRVPFWP